MPTPDEIDRRPTSAPGAEEDDSDYELEPPDAEVIAAEERRAREAVDATRMSIDIDEIYRDADRRRGGEILAQWVREGRFRPQFQVKHLLIATAVLAIALTLWRLELLGTTLVLLLMLSVGGVYSYLAWQEKKQQEEADRRRREMYARNRAYHEKLNRTARSSDAEAESLSDDSGTASATTLDAEPGGAAPKAFRFQFSLGKLLIAMTAAAVVMGVVNLLGGPAQTATILGFVALLGLVISALGFEPPELVVLGWWLVLVLYVLLSILAAIWNSFH